MPARREMSLAVISTLAVTLSCGGASPGSTDQTGALQPGTACEDVTCPAATDRCHVAGACDPSTGTCSAQTAVGCPEGETCSLADGICQPVNHCAGVTCPAPTDGCHVAGLCDPSTGTCSAGAPVQCSGDQVCDVRDGSCKSVAITDLPIPPWGPSPGRTGIPNGIAAGPDGNLWITTSSSGPANLVVRLTPDGKFDEFTAGVMYPSSIAAADGALWYSNSYSTGGQSIHRMATDGTITGSSSVPLASDGNDPNPRGLTPAPDGSVWFVAWRDTIGRVAPDGTLAEFAIPTSGAGPLDIVAGPQGDLWFTEKTANQIGRVAADGKVTGEFPIETAGAAPEGIAAGPDGNVWFTEPGANRIGRVTPGGAVADYLIPTADSGPADIVAGPDGSLWFTESNAGKIGRITPDGAIAEFDVPDKSAPDQIAAGADGSLWFTEREARRIGKVTIH